MSNMLFSLILSLFKDSPDVSWYEKAIDEFVACGGAYLQIDEEPFTYSQLAKLLGVIGDRRIDGIGVRTKGKLLSADVDLLRSNNVRSVMFRYEDPFLDHNMALARASGIPVEVSLVVGRANIGNLDEIIVFCQEQGVKLLVVERSIVSKYRQVDVKPLLPDQYESLLAKFQAHNASGKKPGIALSHCPNKILLHPDRSIASVGGCSAGIVSCAIDTNGNIIPCLPLFPLNQGSIVHDSLADVWENSPLFGQLRDRSSLKGKCGICSFRECCGGCRAESFYAAGDALGEDVSCWLCADEINVLRTKGTFN